MSQRYRVHGLTIASDIELPELSVSTPGDRPADIRIRQGTIAHPANGERADAALVVRDGEAVQLHLPGIARFLIEGGRQVTVDTAPDAEPPLLRVFLLGSVMGMLCHQRGLMVLHASAVAFGGRAIAFAGEQGAGKSTLAAHCMSAGARLVADDVLVVSFLDDHDTLALPGVPGMKLWRHALDGLGRTVNGLTRDWIREDKYHVPCDGRAVESAVPLARICILDHDDAAHAGRTVPLRGMAALASLIANTYRVEYLDVVGGRDRHLRDCARLAATTKVVRLARRRDPRQLAATAAFVAQSLSA